MKFEVLKRLKSCRLGAIRVGNQSIQTPSCCLYTRGGSIPHLVSDVLRSIHNLPSVVHLTLSSLTDQPGVEVVNSSCYNGLMEFLGLEDFISYLSIQDPVQQTREGYNEEKTVSVWTPSGRKKIDVNQFIKVLQAFKPTIAECLCDTIPASQQTEKRIRKSVDRSLKFLDECIAIKESKKELASCSLFGVVEGSNSEKERLRSARETSQRTVSGFVLEGFDSSACNWENLLHKTVQVLPDDKPRVVHGLGTPEEVIIAVENGIDLFDSCYPYQVTERGCALQIKWSRKRLKPDLSYTTGKHEGRKVGDEISDVLKKSNAIATSCEKEDQGRLHEININHSRYMDDFSPLVAGCICYCCRNHTRAYVYHLLVTKEMLGQVLLMVHNFHEYFQFFRGIHSSIAENSFEEFKINFLTEHTHKEIVTT